MLDAEAILEATMNVRFRVAQKRIPDFPERTSSSCLK